MKLTSSAVLLSSLHVVCLTAVAAPWPQIPPPYQTNGANLQVNEPAPVGRMFYHLHKP